MTFHRLAAAPFWLATVLSRRRAPRRRGPPEQDQVPSNPDQVVAEVAGRKITLKDVDEKWEQFDSAERARVSQLLYQNRRTMLDQLVGDILIEQAAQDGEHGRRAPTSRRKPRSGRSRSPTPTFKRSSTRTRIEPAAAR